MSDSKKFPALLPLSLRVAPHPIGFDLLPARPREGYTGEGPVQRWIEWSADRQRSVGPHRPGWFHDFRRGFVYFDGHCEWPAHEVTQEMMLRAQEEYMGAVEGKPATIHVGVGYDFITAGWLAFEDVARMPGLQGWAGAVFYNHAMGPSHTGVFGPGERVFAVPGTYFRPAKDGDPRNDDDATEMRRRRKAGHQTNSDMDE